MFTTRRLFVASLLMLGTAATAQARVRLTLSPNPATAIIDQTQDFVASVEGTARKKVRWRVCDANGRICVLNGNAQLGTIVDIGPDAQGNPIGRYTAPHTLPPALFCLHQGNGCLLRIKVKLASRPEKKATAALSIQDDEPPIPQATLSIAPQDPQVEYGETLQFSATVTNADPSEVEWHTYNGTITPDGLYTAPSILLETDRVWATLRYHGTLPVFSTIHLIPSRPVIDTISPSTAQVRDTVTIQGSGFFGRRWVEFTGPGGIPMKVEAGGTTSAITTMVPLMAMSGPVHVITQPFDFGPWVSNDVAFERVPRLRIRAETRDLAEGETTRLLSRILGQQAPRHVAWSAEQGTISPDGTYSAPAIVSDLSFDRVTGCIAGTDACESLLLGIHPFRIEPFAPIVAQGDRLHLSAFQNGRPVDARWSILVGGGAIQQDGTYTAPDTLEESGSATVVATWQGHQERVSVAVTGAVPGIVNRVNDYIDLTQPWPAGYGTFSKQLAVRGNRAYVRAQDGFQDYQKIPWIDVYDLTDPVRPVWIDAVESALLPEYFGIDGTTLYEVTLHDFDTSPVRPTSTIALYDISSDPPVLVAKEALPGLASDLTFSDGVLYGFPDDRNPTTLQVVRVDLRRGAGVAEALVTLPLPHPDRPYLPSSIAVSRDRLYVGLQQEMPYPETWTSLVSGYDLSTDPPTLLGTADVAFASTMLRVVDGGILLSDSTVYDVSAGPPVRIASYTERLLPADGAGPLVVAGTTGIGLRILDLSDPSRPSLVSSVFDQVSSWFGGSWVGSHVLAAEGAGGLAVLDAREKGGLRQIARIYTGGGFDSAGLNMIVKAPLIYVAGQSDAGAALVISDISEPVPRFVGHVYDTEQPSAFAIAMYGDTAYLGMSDYMGLYDVSTPSDPQLVGRYPLSVVSLFLERNILYVGTWDNRLVMLDVTDPRAPQEMNSVSLPGLPVRIRKKDNVLYVAAREGGLLVYDAMAPASPALLSQLQMSANVYDVDSDGTRAVLAADEDGLVIADVSDPLHPSIVSQTPLADYAPFFPPPSPVVAVSARMRDGIAYVGTLGASAIVYGFDMATPEHPRTVALTADGDYVDTWIATIEFHENDAYFAGYLGWKLGVSRKDARQPRNVIDFYYPPDVLRRGAPPGPAASPAGPAAAPLGLGPVRFCPKGTDGCTQALPWKRP